MKKVFWRGGLLPCSLLLFLIAGGTANLRAQTSPLDTNFKPPFFVIPSPAARVTLLGSGKYVVYLNSNALVEAQSEFLPQNEVTPITRYNADGTRDNSFQFTFNSQVEGDYNNITAVAPLAGDGLYVAAFQQPYGSTSSATSSLLRLNANGSIDATFGVAVQFGPREIRGITVQSDGSILVGGFFRNLGPTSRSGIARILPSGAPDTVFNSNAPQVTGGQYGNGVWSTPVVQPADGKILIGGDFTVVGSTAVPGIARLNRDGTLDAGFVPTGFSITGPVRSIIVQSGGRIVLAGRFSIVGGISNAALIRLNADGSRDASFAQVGGLGRMKAMAQQSDGKFVAVNTSVYRFNPDGTRDTSFRQPALLLNQSSASGVQGSFSVNLQADGKILIGGTFTDVDDEGLVFNGSRFGVARFNSDGTLDTSFTTTHQTGIATAPDSFVLQPDGNTYVAFALSSPSGYPFVSIRHNFGRLTPNGAIDVSYDPLAQQSQILAASGFLGLVDGSLVVQGVKPDLSGDTTPVRVLSNGTVVSLPKSNGGEHLNATVASGFRAADGSLLLLAADAESVIAGKVVNRFSPTGTLDTSFVSDPQITNQMVQRDGSGAVTTVSMTMKLLAGYSDGRILFSYLGTDGIFHLVRLLPNGSIDGSFAAASTAAADVQTEANVTTTDPVTNNPLVISQVTSAPGYADAEIDSTGRCVIVGSFQNYGSSTSKGIVRLTSSGIVDATFNAGAGVQWQSTLPTATFFPLADNIETQGDGKFIVTGTFERFNGTTAPGIVRLNTDGSVDSSFVAPATRIRSDATPGLLKRQYDGSFLLSGPYAPANGSLSPALIHFFGPPVISSPPTAAATLGQPFFYQFLTAGASSRTVTGLPPGLTFDPVLSTINGTITTAGATTVPVILAASNAYGTTTVNLTLTILPAPPSGPVITSTTTASGRAGAPFRFQVITTGGSRATQLSASNLPAGLTFDPASGLISGTPQFAGSTAVNLTVSDSTGNSSAVLQLSFSGDAGLAVIVSSSSASLTAGQQFSYKITAPVIGDPATATTYNLKGTLPAGLSFDPKTGIISGTYQGSPIRDGATSVRSLSGGIISNVQLFATNSHGTTTVPLVFFNAPIGSVNISTRLSVGTADNVLIGGFIVTGNAPKKVVIRAIGPSIKAGDQPLVGALQDTTLELYQGGTLLGSNDDWRSNQEQEILDSGVPPADDRESAVVATLEAQTAYTAILRGKGGTTGIGLAEIYDLGTACLDVSSSSQLANISTRGTVLTSDDVMIGGFIISGASTKVVARAIGPSLTGQGVAGALQDPLLELHDGSGSLIAVNDDWRSTQEQQIKDTGVPPTDDRESAIVATLQPGAYTAIVRGKNDSTGIALAEIYSLR